MLRELGVCDDSFRSLCDSGDLTGIREYFSFLSPKGRQYQMMGYLESSIGSLQPEIFDFFLDKKLPMKD
jgi:hypothetical protein